MIHKGGSIDHTTPHRLSQNHIHPNQNHSQTIYSREDPRPLVTASSAIMIVIDYAKVSNAYPQVVISLLAKRLENLLCAILTLPFLYVPEITTCRYKGLLWVIC
jgi:hypothetical protein